MSDPPTESAADTDQPARVITPPSFLAEPAFAALLAALPNARVVGGAVRDALVEQPIADIDLATPEPPTEVMMALRRAGIRAVPTGLAHGTVTAVLTSTAAGTAGTGAAVTGTVATGAAATGTAATGTGDRAGDGPPGTPAVTPPTNRGIEITTLRRDVATDGRHAIVAFTDDWRQDAARRDFTINAMSMTRDGAIHDYFGGLADLDAGILRFVGDPAQRITEDALRVLRYFRFFARYAAQPPEPALRDALRAGVSNLARLSAERVWGELRRILAAPDPAAAIALMAELGVLAAVVPEGADPAALARLIAAGAPDDPLLRLAALLVGDVTRFADRLLLSAAERQRLMELRTTPLAHPEDDDTTLRRLLADHDRATLIDRTWLATPPVDALSPADISSLPPAPATPPIDAATMTPSPRDTSLSPPSLPSPGASEWVALRTRLSVLPRPVFPLAGSDVLALGVPPGPRVGALLRETRAWWLAGGCLASVDRCRAALARAVQDRPVDSL